MYFCGALFISYKEMDHQQDLQTYGKDTFQVTVMWIIWGMQCYYSWVRNKAVIRSLLYK